MKYLRSFVLCVLWAALFGMPSTAEAQGSAGCGTKGPTRLASVKGAQAVTIDWCNDSNLGANDRVTEIRIDERKGVSVTVKHFNFLHYTLTQSVETVQVETYVGLDKLWKQIFGFVGTVNPAQSFEALSALEEAMAQLRYTAGNIDEALTIELRAFKTPGVSQDQRATLTKLSAAIDAVHDCPQTTAMNLTCARTLLTDARVAVDKAIAGGQLTFDRMAKFDLLRADYNALLDRLTVFQDAVHLIVNGVIKQVSKYKAGTVVTVTFTPVARTPAVAVAPPPFSVEYVSHSRLPLAYHMGYSFSRLKQVDVKTVRALSGQDLFSEVKTGKNTGAMAAFLGYELYSRDRNGEPKFGVVFDLGTDLTKVGDRLYAGLSLRWGRAFIGGGVMGGTITSGVNRVADPISAALGSRELFAEVASKRAWAGYGAITLRVF
ncbi:MAG: hypothetical protein ABIP90_11310 [Vicinamibacterales bacterium]